jgi:hypothetical protein
VHTGFWWETPRERDHMEELGLDEKTILERNFKKKGVGKYGLN